MFLMNRYLPVAAVLEALNSECFLNATIITMLINLALVLNEGFDVS